MMPGPEKHELHNEKELLLLISQSDEAAFSFLFHQYRMPVYMHVLSILKSPERAEEITQDVFLKVWRQRGELAAVVSFENFLFVVTKNYTISEFRKKLIMPDGEVDATLPALTWTPEQQLQFKQINERLREVIERLPAKRKQVFILSRLEGLSHQQIADALHISPGTVNQQLIAALNFIRAALHNHPDFYLLVPVLFIASR